MINLIIGIKINISSRPKSSKLPNHNSNEPEKDGKEDEDINY